MPAILYAPQRAHQVRPCAECPFRVDAAHQRWDHEARQRAKDGESGFQGVLASCHATEHLGPDKVGLCAGWLLDQKRRNVPSIPLRMYFLKDPSALRAYEEVTDGGQEMLKNPMGSEG